MNVMWNNVRKFGLEYCELPTMVWNVAFFLRALAFNIDSRHKKGISVFSYIFTTLIAASYFYVYFFSTFWFVFWRCTETGDLIAATIVFSLCVSSEMGTAKLIFMVAYRDTVRKIVDRALECDALVNRDSRFYRNLMVTLRKVKKRALAFWLVVIANGVIYFSMPLLMPGRHFPEDSFILFRLDPAFESPNYEISQILILGAVIFTVYLPANITAYFIVVAGSVEAQMLALTEEMLHVYDDSLDEYQHIRNSMGSSTDIAHYSSIDDITKKATINQVVKSRLKDIIKKHTININLVNLIEVAFRGAIAAEFGLLIIGLIAELLGGLENTYMELPFAIMQVGMDCLIGQRLMDASMKFENAVYDCKWEQFDVANMRTVLLILQNSQKPLQLSAGGVTMLSFTCFMSVIRLVYSSYTTLRSTMP